MTSCPVTPPSMMVATCCPLSGSISPRVWSPLLATSSKPADEDEGVGESGVKNPAKMSVIARNQVIVIPQGLLAPYYRIFGVVKTPAEQASHGILSSPLPRRCI